MQKDKLCVCCGFMYKASKRQALSWASHLQSGDDFIPHLLDRHHIAAGLRVDDAFLFLPAHHDGSLTVGCAAHLLLFTLRSQRGVGVRCDHGRNQCGNKVEILVFVHQMNHKGTWMDKCRNVSNCSERGVLNTDLETLETYMHLEVQINI